VGVLAARPEVDTIRRADHRPRIVAGPEPGAAIQEHAAMQSESEATKMATSEAAQSEAKGGTASFRSVLTGLVGKTVQIANSESYEETGGTGHSRLTESFYEAKVLALGVDMIKLQTVLKKSKAGTQDEDVTQYLPISRVKRVSVMKRGILIHI
jgi:hypothetical protein